MKLEDRRIIVTGGAGFIGSHLVDLLVDQANDVVVVDDLSIGSIDNLSRHLTGSGGGHRNGYQPVSSVELIEADITDADAMNEVIADADLVIHMAVACIRSCLSRPQYVHRVNASGSLNVALAAQRNRIPRFVYVSSSEAYGSARRVPMDEDHPMDPTTVYGASKLVGEAYSRVMRHTYGMDVIVIRPFNTYGPREYHLGTRAEVIPKFVLRTMAGGRPAIFGSGLQTRDFTWVEDTARGIAAAAAADALVGDTVNIARGQEISIRQLAEKVLTIFGRGGEHPVFDAPRPGDVERHFADTTKAYRLLGWKPVVSIDEGLRRYVDWVVDQEIDVEKWLEEEEQRNW
ncbi:MAG: NAD-dependent epimerase/dehydratase family protein [Acidimicrobiales bacterium]